MKKEQLSVLVTISAEMMGLITARARQLGVTTGSVASCLLENSFNVDTLAKVKIKPAEPYVDEG